MKQAVDPYASFRELTLRGDDTRCVDYGDFYGIQCVFGLEGGLDFCVFDSGCGDFDGGFEVF